MMLDFIDTVGFSPRGSPDHMLMKLLDLTDTAFALNPLLAKIPKSSDPATKNFDTDIWYDDLPMAYSPQFRT